MISSLQQKSQADKEEARYALRQFRQKFILETQSEPIIIIMYMLLILCVEFEEKLNDIERKHRIGSEQLNVLLQYKVYHVYRSFIANNAISQCIVQITLK